MYIFIQVLRLDFYFSSYYVEYPPRKIGWRCAARFLYSYHPFITKICFSHLTYLWPNRKFDILFISKTAENHTLLGRTYLYSTFKGEQSHGVPFNNDPWFYNIWVVPLSLIAFLKSVVIKHLIGTLRKLRQRTQDDPFWNVRILPFVNLMWFCNYKSSLFLNSKWLL